MSASIVPLIFDEYQWIGIADSISFIPLNLPLHGDSHPVGGAYLIAAGAAVLGKNVLGYRLASVIAGSVLVWIAWRLGERLFGSTAGLVAAVLVATNEYLFAVSRLATEASAYLLLAAATLLAFLNLVERQRRRDYVWLGVCLGLGLMMKEMLVLWIPVLAWEFFVRWKKGTLRAQGILIVTGLVALAVLPDLYWNLFLKTPADGVLNRGLAEQLERFGPGFSLAPLALFFRPAVGLIDVAVSEYPAMSPVPGLLLIAAAAASVAFVRGPASVLLKFGWLPVLFFTFLGSPRSGASEFWWADLAIVPFALLTAGLVARIIWLAVLAMALSLPAGIHVARAQENCYPSGWERPAAMDACQSRERSLLALFPDRDHAELSSFAGHPLPVAKYYIRWGTAYHHWLVGLPSDAEVAWPEAGPDNGPDEVVRSRDMLRRLGADLSDTVSTSLPQWTSKTEEIAWWRLRHVALPASGRSATEAAAWPGRLDLAKNPARQLVLDDLRLRDDGTILYTGQLRLLLPSVAAGQSVTMSVVGQSTERLRVSIDKGDEMVVLIEAGPQSLDFGRVSSGGWHVISIRGAGGLRIEAIEVR